MGSFGFESDFAWLTRTRYGTGYYIFHQFVRGTKLSQPIKAWGWRKGTGARCA